jgi:hypothetical protein
VGSMSLDAFIERLSEQVKNRRALAENLR